MLVELNSWITSFFLYRKEYTQFEPITNPSISEVFVSFIHFFLWNDSWIFIWNFTFYLHKSYVSLLAYKFHVITFLFKHNTLKLECFHVFNTNFKVRVEHWNIVFKGRKVLMVTKDYRKGLLKENAVKIIFSEVEMKELKKMTQDDGMWKAKHQSSW